MWKNWISIIAGLWLIVSGIILPLVAVSNLVITGAIVFILGLLALRYFNGMIMVVLGFWMFFSGLIVSLATPANFIINGALILIFSAWVISSKQEHVLTY